MIWEVYSCERSTQYSSMGSELYNCLTWEICKSVTLQLCSFTVALGGCSAVISNGAIQL